ncbi:MAG: quinone-dependent dihydroorotate dehydrogenase [Chthoniobacterales bacterium]
MNPYPLIRPLLFRMNAETAHDVTLRALRIGSHLKPLVSAIAGGHARALPRKVFGIEFPNPIGLAAGLDKNGVALPAWEALGFGFVEIGTITAYPQPGNPKPRLFRLPDQEALINRMGFNNDGAEVVAQRLERLKISGRWPRIPVGINIGKSRATPLENAAEDYLESFRMLFPYGDYFVINVSSPNTPGLRSLQNVDALKRILCAMRDLESSKPILVKIAPDLAEEEIVEIARLAEREHAAGLIATNTTINHRSVPQALDETGGLSGLPLRAPSTDVIRLIKKHSPLPVIGVGGIMRASDAAEKLDVGAELVQIYTGLIYRGPGLIREICRRIG